MNREEVEQEIQSLLDGLGIAFDLEFQNMYFEDHAENEEENSNHMYWDYLVKVWDGNKRLFFTTNLAFLYDRENENLMLCIGEEDTELADDGVVCWHLLNDALAWIQKTNATPCF